MAEKLTHDEILEAVKKIIARWKKHVIVVGTDEKSENQKLKLITEKPAGWQDKLREIVERQINDNRREVISDKQLRSPANKLHKILHNIMEDSSRFEERLAKEGLEFDNEFKKDIQELISIGRMRCGVLTEQKRRLEFKETDDEHMLERAVNFEHNNLFPKMEKLEQSSTETAKRLIRTAEEVAGLEKRKVPKQKIQKKYAGGAIALIGIVLILALVFRGSLFGPKTEGPSAEIDDELDRIYAEMKKIVRENPYTENGVDSWPYENARYFQRAIPLFTELDALKSKARNEGIDLESNKRYKKIMKSPEWQTITYFIEKKQIPDTLIELLDRLEQLLEDAYAQKPSHPTAIGFHWNEASKDYEKLRDEIFNEAGKHQIELIKVKKWQDIRHSQAYYDMINFVSEGETF